MRILYVLSSPDSPHAERWVGAAIAAGHDVRAVATNAGADPHGVVRARVDIDAPWPARGVRWAGFVRRCREEIRRFDPEIVHVHFLTPTPTVLGWTHHPRVIVTAWGTDVVGPLGVVGEWSRRRGLRAATVVTAASRALAYACRAHLPLDARVEVIPFGVDLDRFRPGGERPPGTSLHIGCVKTLAPIYGQETLLDAMVRVRAAVPDAHLTLIGDGPTRSVLEARVRARGLGDAVTFAGRVSPHELPERLVALDVLAMPSRFESFGVAALEAAACGLPVVAGDGGGVAEVVRDGETGYLVRPGDAEGLAERLIALADPERRRVMGGSGRSLVEREFAWRDCVDRMHALYEEVRR